MGTLNKTEDQSNAVSTFENSSPSAVSEILSPEGNGNSLSSENPTSAATTVTVEQPELGNQQEFLTSHSPSSPKGIKVINIHRSHVCSDMVRYFQDETITTESMVFENY